MDGIKQQIRARQVEAVENRHQFEVKKLKRELRDELDKLSENNKATITKIKTDYDKEALNEKNQMETKLIGIRKKNKEILEGENMRFERMVSELQDNHKTKLAELQIAQDKEIEKRESEHQIYLENAEQKFESEKVKYEA